MYPAPGEQKGRRVGVVVSLLSEVEMKVNRETARGRWRNAVQMGDKWRALSFFRG